MKKHYNLLTFAIVFLLGFAVIGTIVFIETGSDVIFAPQLADAPALRFMLFGFLGGWLLSGILASVIMWVAWFKKLSKKAKIISIIFFIFVLYVAIIVGIFGCFPYAIINTKKYGVHITGEKEGKKGFLRVIGLGVAILVMLVLAFAYQHFSEKKQRKSEADIDKQIDIFVKELDEWADFTGYFYFTVTDLNRDRKLELITSTIQGSSSFAYNNFYIVQENDSKIVNLSVPKDTMGGTALFNDFLTGESVDYSNRLFANRMVFTPVYFDSKAGQYHYILHDYSGHTPYEAYDRIIALTLKDGMVFEEVLASKIRLNDTEFDEEYRLFFVDANQNNISEEDYNKIAENTFANCERMQLHWKWLRVEKSDDLKNMSSEEIKDILFQMYENFGVE